MRPRGVGQRLGALVLSVGLGSAAAQESQEPWRVARPDRQLELPADHASHPEYRIEWWYYTGNVQDAAGDRFGFQLTFFRIGVDFAPENPSRWAVRDLHMAHLAITDVERETFRFAERLSRAGVGLAGAETSRYRVWIEAWEATRTSSGQHRLTAAGDGIGLTLALDETRPPALHGERGFSRKGAAEGNATHYYSLTRMPTRGVLRLDGREIEVEGESWMDHEFGTSFLEPGQRGWDWFSLQLRDGTELMLFQLRRDDGSTDVYSAGSLIDADGRVTPLNHGEFALEPAVTWRSPASGARYPTSWRIAVPAYKIDLSVTALVAGQELSTVGSTGITYWEGAVSASGTRDGEWLDGVGYLEMTGYAGVPMSSVLR